MKSVGAAGLRRARAKEGVTMAGSRQIPQSDVALPRTSVRVLHGEEELAEAVARAAEGARRLHDRLEARAARDAWMAEHPERRVTWLRILRGPGDPPRVQPVAAKDPGSGTSAA